MTPPRRAQLPNRRESHTETLRIDNQTFEPPVMSLLDGAQVCDQPDHACLISYGNGRRMEAVGALGSLGIKPPAWWEL